MSKMEDFENAPFGATATHDNGSRAMKTDKVGRSWILQNKIYLDDEEMAHWNYTLDPSVSAPTTAREALDLAWELAHEVKEGQHIPDGVRLLDRFDGNDFSVYTTLVGFTSNAREALTIRTLDPLPDPEPDWLDAPAVLASDKRDDTGDCHPWINVGGGEWFATRRLTTHWSTLRHVTPLYPKGQDA